MNLRFGSNRVKRGLIHFLIGKAVSALAGLLAVILVVQGLSVSDFAAYSILIALVEVFTAFSGLGLSHVVLRYIPELYVSHRSVSLRFIILSTFAIRFCLLFAILFTAYMMIQPFGLILNLTHVISSFELFLLVVILRSSSHFLSQILDSTLHQGISQVVFSVSSIGRCVGILWLFQTGQLDLFNLVALEAICDAFACCFLALGSIIVLRSVAEDKDPHIDDLVWWPNHQKTVANFAMSAYLQHIATLPFGGNTNRLVGGVMFGDRVMANFGFAQSLYEYFKRYLPTQLLIGLIRPIVVARFSVNRNFYAVTRLCDQALSINIIIIFGAISILSVVGIELLTLVSDGKYGVESLWLLISMLILLVLETQRLILEVLTQTVEQYGLMIPGSFFLSASVLVGISGYPFVGAISFPVANALALFFANFWLFMKLKNLGYLYQHDWYLSKIIIILFCTAVASGFVFKFMGANWVMSGCVTAAVYVVLFMKYLLKDSLSFVRDLVSAPR